MSGLFGRRPREEARAGWTAGQRLERLLLDRGMTKGGLARAAGVSPSTVYRMCEGTGGSLASWEKAAAALGMRVSDITGR